MFSPPDGWAASANDSQGVLVLCTTAGFQRYPQLADSGGALDSFRSVGPVRGAGVPVTFGFSSGAPTTWRNSSDAFHQTLGIVPEGSGS